MSHKFDYFFTSCRYSLIYCLCKLQAVTTDVVRRVCHDYIHDRDPAVAAIGMQYMRVLPMGDTLTVLTQVPLQPEGPPHSSKPPFGSRHQNCRTRRFVLICRSNGGMGRI